MISKYKNFIAGLAFSIWGKIGVVLTTSSFIIFLIFETAQTIGLIRNAYIGLITYLLFPLLFVIGLVFIPVAWIIYKKERGMTTRELLNERFPEQDLRANLFGSRIFMTVLMFTILNIVFIGAVGMRMLHFMDQSKFCGTACHTVMNPEWVTYQQSPHARVNCVECHVGEGAVALIDSKINGVRQMLLAAFNMYSTPIPTPVHRLRPSRDTCEKCHWPEKFYGRRIVTHTHFQSDSLSTPLFNTLILKIDAGSKNEKAGIHWHVGEHTNVQYASVNDKQKEILWVEVLKNDSLIERYTNRDPLLDSTNYRERHIMDCIDCHNRATHIYNPPDIAVDNLIHSGQIDNQLPFIKREALSAITKNYPSQQAAMEGIKIHLSNFYLRNNPGVVNQISVEKAITELCTVFNRYIHHQMKITWNTYPSHLNHKKNGGCFRCHNQNLRTKDGRFIRNDCNLCHSLMAYEEKEPFKYIAPADSTDPDYLMQNYLRQDAIDSW